MAIQVTTREKLGKSASKAARREGKTPITVYGKDFDAYSGLVETHEIEQLLRSEGRNAVFEVNIDGTPKRVMFANIERNPIRNDILNLQLRVLAAGQKVEVQIPIEVLNTEVITEGVVTQTLMHVDVNVDPSNIPTSFEVDVDGMEIGDSKLVSDLGIPGDIEIITELDETVVSVAAPRVEEEPEETEEIDPAAVETTAQSNDDDDADTSEEEDA